ncbi:hypothetical protein ACFP1L_09200 [Lactiplantibacillus nangangensis]|uniref:Uncharacterized protein n=1 Tax=Lactiplantibacillus nangangensis TaxID=2559917 RepID=A0ABW1SLD3_9LACO|nr:hypothetical protein [Lactiplantibacillus nangangensis]
MKKDLLSMGDAADMMQNDATLRDWDYNKSETAKTYIKEHMPKLQAEAKHGRYVMQQHSNAISDLLNGDGTTNVGILDDSGRGGVPTWIDVNAANWTDSNKRDLMERCAMAEQSVHPGEKITGESVRQRAHDVIANVLLRDRAKQYADVMDNAVMVPDLNPETAQGLTALSESFNTTEPKGGLEIAGDVAGTGWELMKSVARAVTRAIAQYRNRQLIRREVTATAVADRAIQQTPRVKDRAATLTGMTVAQLTEGLKRSAFSSSAHTSDSPDSDLDR